MNTDDAATPDDAGLSVIHIHYDASSGEICGLEINISAPIKQQGLEVTTCDVKFIPDSKLHKIDLTTLEIVDKSPEERALALLPPPVTLDEIRAAIKSELWTTDAFMMPDRPLSDSVRLAWREYRQMLRDLSKLAPQAIVEAWGRDPDGRDAAASMRGRDYAGH